ncbi:LegC2/C7 family Dot/Icm T4SS effector [Legionella sp. D16C41]|uniref:LegC2/C7 family Dot/Icm T4SS effector n=1 Tax=Legionella sp. D16C41 TaxID=3402688 RepID=UPI003AF43BED
MNTEELKNNIAANELNIEEPNVSEEESNDADKEDKLQQINFTQNQLKQMKEELDKMIEAFAQNTSLLSRAAKFWGQLPWWQKVIAGSIVIVPLFVVSILTHIVALFIISFFTLFTYVASSLLLDNHHKQSQNDKDNLKKGILNLADTLGIVIESLEKLRSELAHEISKFKKENKHLTALVEQLSQEVEQLHLQVSHLVNVEKQLTLTKDELHNTSTNFANAVEEHTKLLAKNKLQLEKTIKDYEESQVQLSAKIFELDEVKTKMGLELDQANNVALTLQGTIDNLINTVIPETENQRLIFQERLQEFLADRKKGFEQMNEHVTETNNKLRLVQEELRRSNERYEELLNRSANHIDRLERTYNATVSSSPTAALKEIGFYAVDKPTKQEAPENSTLILH